MIATELKIGNIVKYKDEERILPERRGKHHIIIADDILAFSEGYDVIVPVELNEEWLIRFGFIKDAMFTELAFDPRMSIRFYHGNSAECDITQDGNVISFKCAHLKYVHQLQNLYRALTNTELICAEKQHENFAK